MQNRLPLFVIFALGCSTEASLTAQDSELEVNPALLDFGDVALGQIGTAELQVDHLSGAAIDIRNVTFSQANAPLFAFAQAGEVLTVERGERLVLPLTYTPDVEGFHWSTVAVTHTGRDSPTILDVRGHALVPEASITPLLLDVGPVALEAVGTGILAVHNDSPVSLPLTAIEVGGASAGFTVDAPVEEIAGWGSVDLTVTYTPVDAEAAEAEVTVWLGDLALPTVGVRANDCVRGLPTDYDQDEDGVTTCGGDCDDADAEIGPGTPEAVDGIDQDCDGSIDEGTAGADDDGDGYCDDPVVCTDGSDPGDCNDGAVGVFPSAAEVLGNGIDDDCDGVVDAGTVDLDGDGYGPGVGGDCDDADVTVFPGAPELVDGIDNDCDTVADEGTEVFDDDGDGVTELAGDCDDADANTYPGAVELADFRDNTCDGVVDEMTVNFDDDGDGYTETGGDCDDTDALLSPGLGTCP